MPAISKRGLLCAVLSAAAVFASAHGGAPAGEKRWEIKFNKAGGEAKLKKDGPGGQTIKAWQKEDGPGATDLTPWFKAAEEEIRMCADLTRPPDGVLLLSLDVLYGGEKVESWNVSRQQECKSFKRH